MYAVIRKVKFFTVILCYKSWEFDITHQAYSVQQITNNLGFSQVSAEYTKDCDRTILVR